MFYFLCLVFFLELLIPAVTRIIALWFDKKYLFIMNSLAIGGGATAFIIGLNLTLPISKAIGGWRNFFVLLGILMAVLAILWMIVIPERSSKDAALNRGIEIKHAEENKFWQNIKICFVKPKSLAFYVWLSFSLQG